jgi:hypothetical protein
MHARVTAKIQAVFSDPVTLVLNSGRNPTTTAKIMSTIGDFLEDTDRQFYTSHSVTVVILDDVYHSNPPCHIVPTGGTFTNYSHWCEQHDCGSDGIVCPEAVN